MPDTIGRDAARAADGGNVNGGLVVRRAALGGSSWLRSALLSALQCVWCLRTLGSIA